MTKEFDLDRALETLRGRQRLLICTHDDPDPDALAAAWGMRQLLERELGCEATVAFDGIIGRAENRAMVRELGIRLRRIEALDPSGYDGVVLMDTQPGALNHSAPASLPVLACVDHHAARPSGAPVPWLDVRPDGECTATIVLEYLRRRDVPLSPELATGILYALKTDTRDLSRGASDRDLQAWNHVSPLADMRALGRIVNPPLAARYFHMLLQALRVARVHGDAVLVQMGPLDYPDLVAEAADLFVRSKGQSWCLCGGTFDGVMRLSLRTEDEAGHAGRLAQALVRSRGGSAGGHGMTAGGRIPLDADEDPEALWETVAAEFIRQLGQPEESAPLCAG
jgi:nanoRNase/pAp phosphatase (c-di-AMP/oligoRNAs hydrolase)